MKLDLDRSMRARVIARRPMRYARGADASIDRPAHVRAASALVWVGARLCVVQDDASFLGVVDPSSGLVDDVPFAAGPGGARTFDVARGNKRDKPDLEAAFALDDVLIAIGSGGPIDARQVIVTWRPGEDPRMLARPRLFAALARAIVGGDQSLNLEGATRVRDEVWIANRGGDRGSADAIARWPRSVFDQILADETFAPPAPSVETIELGAIDGVPLHLTEIRTYRDRVWFTAAAEATDSFYDDGANRGSAIGTLDRGYAILEDTREKIEGLAVSAQIFACIDADDPSVPAALLELQLDV
ncbi:MAG TPA: hypothetical protein VL463_05140 [Kofleriaceae bacterium]|nr:hypothetical protein [Kofleriaceae bacterium]